MAYVYNGTGYRAGAAGVDADLELRRLMAEAAARDQAAQAGLPTGDQMERARGDLQDPLNRYRNLADNGMYSAGEQDAILSSRVQQVNNTARAMQQNINTQIAQRGGAGNAGMNAALGLSSQFEAAGQRGQAYGDLMSEQAQSKIAGLAGYGDLSGKMAAYAATPTARDNSGKYSDMYEKWRNEQVGYDGAQWGTTPTPPSYYAGGGNLGGRPGVSLQPYTGALGHIGGTATGGTPYGLPKKKKNYVY